MSASATIPTPAPPDLITFTITIDGKELSGKYHILEISVYKAVNKIPSAKITLADGDAATEDFPISNTDDLIPGKVITIAAGYQSKESVLFKGVIARHNIAIGNAKTTALHIECKDPAAALTVNRNSTIFEAVTDSDAIDTIIGTYSGDGVTSGTLTTTSVQYPQLVQYNALDWDFMLSRAEANGLLVFVNDGEISVEAPDTSSSPALQLRYGDTILSYNAKLGALSQQQSVKAFSWNPAEQAITEVEGNSPDVAEGGNLSASDLADVFASDSCNLYSTSLSEDELQNWADATFLRSELAKVCGEVTFQGYAGIKPGDVIEIQGVGDRLNGSYFVAGICHTIKNGNWLTTVHFGLSSSFFSEQMAVSVPSASGLLPAVSGLEVGKVVQLQDDPDSEGRILVKLPLIEGEGLTGVWARLATSYAGTNRGISFLPEIDDEVIVGFLNDDPRSPVVLGSVHSSANPSPVAATDENFQKGITTGGALKLLFDDEKKVTTVETPGGNTLVLSDDAKGITLKDQNGNSIVMDSNGITINSAKDITMNAQGDVTVQGVNVNLEAQAKLAGKGSAGVQIESSANMVLKGALVQIN